MLSPFYKAGDQRNLAQQHRSPPTPTVAAAPPAQFVVPLEEENSMDVDFAKPPPSRLATIPQSGPGSVVSGAAVVSAYTVILIVDVCLRIFCACL